MRRALLAALCLALLLCGCGPAESPPSPAPPEASAPPMTVVYLGSGIDPLSSLVSKTLEDWAEEESWEYISYDCRGYAVSQTGQAEDVARLGKTGVAVLYGVGGESARGELAKTLSRGDFRVITLDKDVDQVSRRYVCCHIGMEEEDVIAAAADVMNQGVGDRDAQYLLVAQKWPEPRQPVWEEALRERYTRVSTVYGGESREISRQVTAQGLEELERPPKFIFAVTEAAAIGAAQGAEEAETPCPVFTLRGTKTGLDLIRREKGLAGLVTLSPKELLDRLREAIPQVGEGRRLGTLPLTPVGVTRDNVEDLLGEYK